MQFQAIPRIESSELHSIPLDRETRIPLRLGRGKVGLLIAKRPEPETVRVAFIDKRKCGFDLRLHSFTKDRLVHHCVRCPCCDRVRQRLFLNCPDKNVQYAFRCIDCI